MTDLQFRQALRAWHSEGTPEARERVITLAQRQGMDHWDVFEFMLGLSDMTFHAAVSVTEDEDMRGVLALLAEHLATLEMNAFAEGSWSTGHQEDYGYSSFVNGTQYNIGYVDYKNRGQAFVLEENTHEIYVKDSNYLHRVENPEIIDEVRNQRAQDLIILASRYYLARQAAGDDPVLYRIYEQNINYNAGAIDEPTIVDEIPFWQVGRNASHGFYFGYRDGQLYRMSEGYEYDVQGNSFLDRHITPIEDFSGYMGHY